MNGQLLIQEIQQDLKEVQFQDQLTLNIVNI